jgi:putative membrane protein
MKMNPESRGVRYLSHGLVAAVALWSVASAMADDRDTQSTTTQRDTLNTSGRHDTTSLDRKEASFIKEAAQGGLAEVQMGKLAAEKGQNQEIKQLGQRLEQDHSKANQELTQLAQTKGVTLPSEPPRKEERMADKLQDKTGADFDKAFAEHAIKDHEKDITKFEKALRDCKDSDLRAFIEKTLPVLRQHLQMARNAGSTVGVDQKVLSSADRFISGDTGKEGVGHGLSTETGRSTTGTGPDRGTTSPPK